MDFDTLFKNDFGNPGTEIGSLESNDFDTMFKNDFGQQPFNAFEYEKNLNVETKPNIRRAVESGWHESIGLLHGTAAMFKDMVGMEEGRDKSLAKYQEHMREAAVNPVDIPTWFPVEGSEEQAVIGPEGKISVPRAIRYGIGQVEKQIPNIMGSVASGLAGAELAALLGQMGPQAATPEELGTVPAGFVAGLFSKKAVKEMVDVHAKKIIADAIAKGAAGEITEEIAKKTAAKAINRQINKTIGAKLGVVLFSSAIESGGMYAGEAEKGIYNPWSALGLGILSGSTDAMVGVGGKVSDIIGMGDIKNVFRKTGLGGAADVLWNGLENAVEEGGQEFLQELIQGINSEINDPNYRITDRESFMQWAEAGIAGAFVGGLSGGGGGAYNTVIAARKDAIDQNKEVELSNQEFLRRMEEMAAQETRMLTMPEGYRQYPQEAREGQMPQYPQLEEPQQRPPEAPRSMLEQLQAEATGPAPQRAAVTPQQFEEPNYEQIARAKGYEAQIQEEAIAAEQARLEQADVVERLGKRLEGLGEKFDKMGVTQDEAFKNNNANELEGIVDAVRNGDESKFNTLAEILVTKAERRSKKLEKRRRELEKKKQGGIAAMGATTQATEAGLAGSTPAPAQTAIPPELAGIPQFTQKAGEAEAKRLGITFNGNQEIGIEGFGVPLFTDNETKGTFSPNPGETVEQALIRQRKKFGTKAVAEPASAAEGQIINTSPTEGQKEAGNYKKGHVNIDGYDVSIENPIGSIRSGVDRRARRWSTTMKADYGYIRGSVGYDKDHVDVFIKPDYVGGNDTVYVVNQVNPNTGKFDEHKAIFGADSESDAKAVYLSNYEKGWKGLKNIVKMTQEEFKAWAMSEEPKKGEVKPREEAAPKPTATKPETKKESSVVEVTTLAQASIELGKGNKVHANKATVWVEPVQVKWGETWTVLVERDGAGYAMQTGGAVNAWDRNEAIDNALSEVKSQLARMSKEPAKAPAAEQPAPTPKEQRQERRAEERKSEDEELKALFGDLKKLRNRLNVGVDPEIMIVGTKIAAVYIKKGYRNFRDFASEFKDQIGEDWDAFKKYLQSFWSAAQANSSEEPYFDDIEDVSLKQALTIINELDTEQKEEITKPKEAGNETVQGNVPVANEGAATAGERTTRGGETGRGGERGGRGIRKPSGGSRAATQAGGGEEGVARTEGRAGNEPRKVNRPGSSERRAAIKRDPRNHRNYRITDDDAIGSGGWKQKAQDNLEAIRILHRLSETGREATYEEKQKLVKYVGWGASELANGVFPNPRTGTYKEGWEDIGTELKALLSPKEYDAARASTINAHYTSSKVIRGIYNALQQFGFDGGKILEPGVGIGHFIGLMPDSFLDGSRFTGVELDPTTAHIARALYPDADIRNVDYTKFSAPDNFYDVAVGNPPFANIVITSDRRYRDERFQLHDYFFAKSIDKVRPGGLVVFVTSKGTMDKVNDRARNYLAKQADLVGAIRLPQTAFKANAGTEVVTDVLFLRKRQIYEQPAGQAWNKSVEIRTPEGPATVNEYYKKHPEMVLGEHRLTGSMYRANELTVVPRQGADIEEEFLKAVSKLPKAIYEGRTVENNATNDERQIGLAPDHIKENAYFIGENGEIYQKVEGASVPVKVREKGVVGGIPKAHKILLRSYIPLRDAVRDVLFKQVTGVDDQTLMEAQKEAVFQYNAFVKKHGPINKFSRSERMNPKTNKEIITVRYQNVSPLKEDPDIYLIASIERFDEETGKAIGLGGLLTKRIIGGAKEVRIETVEDALGVSLDRFGRVDISMIAGELGIPETEAIESLGNSIYLDPNTESWVTDDEYLSGNVKRKLAEAITAAKADEKYARNVSALEDVQPRPLEPADITLSLGMPIIETKYIEKFFEEILELHATVHYDPRLNQWTVLPTNLREPNSDKATIEWGGGGRNAFSLLDSALNQKSIRIMKSVWEAGKTRTVFDPQATEAANEKLMQIKDAFRSWVFNDHPRTVDIVGKYNDVYNTDAPRRFNGEHLSLPGINNLYVPYPHQKNVAWRIIQTGNTYMAHEVGAGKTIASVIAGMEMKRLGMIKKPQYVVPNHMLKQFSSELLDLYPAAKILVADEEQFAKNKRNRFMGRIAAEEWDAIIITHSAFKKIPISPDFETGMVEDLLSDLRDFLEQAKSDNDRITTKNLEAMIKRQEEKLGKLRDQTGKDKGVFFEDTGIDFLFIDEAHEFRKLTFATNMSSLKGIDPNGSEMAWDLYMKSRYLESKTPNRSLVLMSGTPITNTMGELYTVLRYLSEPTLREADIAHFDAWAATFGEERTRLEATPGGKYQPVTRFSSFHNIGDLAKLWARIGDVIKTRDLSYMTSKLPKIKGGQRDVVIAKQTEAQKLYKRQLNARLEAIKARRGPPKPGDDIVLSVITDGRHAAIDQRFINPLFPPDPESKLEMMIDGVFKVWKETEKSRLTQMIFSDLGVPSALDRRGFSVYLQVRDELVKRGIPAKEIAFMQDYKSHEKKRKLFKAVNNGDIRILIGSSKAMGTGVNAQRKLKALHHLDAPWYPADLIQREGRIVRQGNTNKEVELFAYVTKGSFDETMWQLLETKQRFIDQIMAGDQSLRVADDIDTEADQFALAKAMSSDNPLVLELAGLEAEIARLERLRQSFINEQFALKNSRDHAEHEIGFLQQKIGPAKEAVSKQPDTKGDLFEVVLDGKKYTERKDAAEALKPLVEQAAIKSLVRTKGEPWKEDIGREYIGEIGQFKVYVRTAEKGFTRRLITTIGTEADKGNGIFQTAEILEVNIGTVRQIENTSDYTKLVKSFNDRLAQAETDLENANRLLEKKFSHEESLASKKLRVSEIKNILEKEAKESEEQARKDAQEAAVGEEANIEIMNPDEVVRMINHFEGRTDYRTESTTGRTAGLRFDQFTDAQKKRAINLLRSMFGTNINVETVAQKLMTPDGQAALGQYRDSWITLVEGRGDIADTALHEAVHAAIDMFLTAEEKARLLEAVGSDEEKLAEGFVQYAKDRMGLPGKIKVLAHKLLRILRKLFGGTPNNSDRIAEFYDKLAGGGFVAAQQRATMQQAEAYRPTNTYEVIPDELAPKKIQRAYKLMRLGKNGELFPLYAKDDDRSRIAFVFGKWNRAEYQRPSIGGRQLAERPGIHAVAIPAFPQGKGMVKGEKRVWVEFELPAMNPATQKEAGKNGLSRVPRVDEAYDYRTNANAGTAAEAWPIAGSGKPIRVLSDAEVADILKKAGHAEQIINSRTGISDAQAYEMNAPKYRTERMSEALGGGAPTKEMYDRYAQGKTVPQRVAEKAKKAVNRINESMKDWFQVLSLRVQDISPEAYQRVKRLMAEIDIQTAKDMKVVKNWQKAEQMMSPDDRLRMDLARTNADADTINELIKKYGKELGTAYTTLRKTLDAFLDRMEEVGLEPNRLETYHPRVVKDHVGLLTYLKGTEYWTAIETEITRRNMMLKDSNNRLSAEESAIIADKMMRGTIPGIPAAKTSNMKKRVFMLVTPEMMEFYAKPDNALVGYIRQNNRTIEWLKMFGAVDKETGNKLKKLAAVRKRLTSAIERERNAEIALASARESGDVTRSDALKEMLKEATSNVFKQRGALENLLEELGFDGSGSLAEGAKFIENSIGAIVNELAGRNDLTVARSVELKKLIKDLWNDMGITNPLLSGYRDLTLAAALGQVSSAITQIQDNAWSMFENGFWHTSKAYGSAIARKSKVTRDSLTADINPEFSHTKTLSWILNNILKWTGMSWLDAAGKEGLANASIARMQEDIRKAKAGDKTVEASIKERLAGIFSDMEFYQVMADLLEGDPENHNVKLFAHYMVSVYQPLNRAETPASYHGNNRFFYMLKTYQIKQLNNYRQQLGGRLKKAMENKDWESASEAMRAIVHMAIWLAILGAGSDILKDLVYGRKIEPKELTWDVVGQLVGISRWDAYNIRREGLSSAVMKRIVPQNKIIDNVYKDITQPDSRGLRSIGLMPVVGKFLYWRQGRGASINAGKKNTRGKTIKRSSTESEGFKGFSSSGGGFRGF